MTSWPARVWRHAGDFSTYPYLAPHGLRWGPQGQLYCVCENSGVVLEIVPTHKQLADLVGASRPKVSEVMNDLRRRKALSREGRKLTIAVKQLEAIVASEIDT